MSGKFFLLKEISNSQPPFFQFGLCFHDILLLFFQSKTYEPNHDTLECLMAIVHWTNNDKYLLFLDRNGCNDCRTWELYVWFLKVCVFYRAEVVVCKTSHAQFSITQSAFSHSSCHKWMLHKDLKNSWVFCNICHCWNKYTIVYTSSFAIKKPVWLCRWIKSRRRQIQTFDLNNN